MKNFLENIISQRRLLEKKFTAFALAQILLPLREALSPYPRLSNIVLPVMLKSSRPIGNNYDI
jgi:hypothetical protein